jgi:hypothetical protein
MVRVRNGTAFFLDAGNGPFCVTASHVVEGWKQDCKNLNVVALQLGNLAIDFGAQHAVIAAHDGIDIATFCISTDEIRKIGKTVLTGFQGAWPPQPPQRDVSCGARHRPAITIGNALSALADFTLGLCGRRFHGASSTREISNHIGNSKKPSKTVRSQGFKTWLREWI